MLFLAPVFCFVLSNVVFVYIGEGAVNSDSYRYRLAYESMQVVYHAIQPSVLAEHLGFSDGRCCYLRFLWISPDVADSVEWSRHK